MNKKLSTKQRLLNAACSIFAEKGYQAATVSEICEQADANIAAVNYHFGDKKSLYMESFRHLFQLSDETYPRTAPPGADAEQWLRCFVRRRIHCIFDDGPAGLLPKLLHKEMGQPTEIHQQLRNELIEPMRNQVKEKVLQFLGPETTEEELSLAELNFSSIHIFMNVGKQKCANEWGSMDGELLIEQIEHFSMGGLQATREYLNQRRNDA